MKSKTNRFEKSRYRRDYFFGVLVTAFGLLVLAIFATLLLHILSNALPLLKSPNSEKIHAITSDFADSSIGSTQIQGDWVNVSVEDCSVYITHFQDPKVLSPELPFEDSAGSFDEPLTESLTTVTSTSRRIVKKFAPNCAKQVIGLAGEQNKHLLMLTNDNVLEVYLLESKESLLLKGSIALPKAFVETTIIRDLELSVASNIMVNVSSDVSADLSPNAKPNVSADVKSWEISLSDNKLFIQRPLKISTNTHHIITLTHSLSSLNAPTVRIYKDAVQLLPIVKFDQVLVATHHDLRMYNNQMNLIQRWSLFNNDDPKSDDFKNDGINTGDSKKGNNDSNIDAYDNDSADKDELGIQNTDKKALYSRDVDNTYSSHINSLSVSPSSLDVFVRILSNSIVSNNIINNNIAKSEKQSQVINHAPAVNIKKFTLVNTNGDFLLREIMSLPMPLALGKGGLYTAYDLQHNAGFFVDEYGQFVLMNIVTGEIKLQKRFKSRINAIHYSQGQMLLTFDDTFELYQFTELQGMTSMQILFGKNDYSGYDSNEYLWQTSVSSAAQSPKYSVIPLVMGSLKASVLALIVALPLALGAAIYTAYFAPVHIRNAIKPSIEMLEAIPSVVIGFIAAVWLAPFAEQYLISIFSVIILLPFVVLVIAAIHGLLQTKITEKKLDNWQLPINAILLCGAIVFIFLLSLLITDWSISSGHDSLVESASNLSLSKTAIVVALALGVAIAPTIYTLIDDALFEVPEGVKQASFALGASKIQTLVKVVLVVAFPSIVSAIMLGFGRAFGETMIVLMVTGNTPIANWDLLSGLRTLTSNLAIELQEAPVDSTPYHILFLTAAILFAFTFVVNTIAALVKRRAVHND